MRKLATVFATIGLAGFLMAGNKDKNKTTTPTATTRGTVTVKSTSSSLPQTLGSLQKKGKEVKNLRLGREKVGVRKRKQIKTQEQIPQEVRKRARKRIQNRQRHRNFIDEDGDGINDLLQDADGDGIPNGKDPDWMCPNCGSRVQTHVRERDHHQNRQGMTHHECPHSGGSKKHQEKYRKNDRSPHRDKKHDNGHRHGHHHHGGNNNHHG